MIQKGKYFFFLLAFVFAGYLCNLRTDGFQISKIISGHSYKKNFQLGGQKKNQVSHILNQKFYYLAKGRQCFVFESEDQQYVMKFINHSRFRVPFIFRWMKQDAVEQFIEKRKKRIESTFQSIQLAHHFLKDQAALILIHFSSDPTFQKKLTIIDRIGYEHQIDMSQVDFILQRKATMIYPALLSIHEKFGEEKLKEALSSLAHVLTDRVNQLIDDDDLDIEINYGFVQNQAIVIDVGRFSYNPELQSLEMRKKEVYKTTKYFRKWLKDNFPHLSSFFEEELLKKLYLETSSYQRQAVSF